MLDTILYLVPALAIVGLIYMFVQSRWVSARARENRVWPKSPSTSTRVPLHS